MEEEREIGKKVISRVQYTKLSHAFSLVLSTILVILLFVPIPMIHLRALLYERGRLLLVLIAAGILSFPAGWWIYKRVWHCTFSYDEKSFEFRIGKSKVIRGRWKDYNKVSVARSSWYEFSIRLYKNDKEYVELPIGRVKLDPFEFRDEVERFMKRG